MTEHSFEYPADFKPEKHCSQFAMTDSRCCAHSPNQRDCEVIQGYHKARHSHEPKSYGWVEFTALALSISAVVYAVIQGI